MSDDNKIPENSATNSPPDELQETTFECDCGLEFDDQIAYAEHSMDCRHSEGDDE